jgi:hypothetical protein
MDERDLLRPCSTTDQNVELLRLSHSSMCRSRPRKIAAGAAVPAFAALRDVG